MQNTISQEDTMLNTKQRGKWLNNADEVFSYLQRDEPFK